jgi:hypothetical protein
MILSCGTVPGSEPPDTSSLLAIASMAESHIFSVEDGGPIFTRLAAM